MKRPISQGFAMTSVAIAEVVGNIVDILVAPVGQVDQYGLPRHFGCDASLTPLNLLGPYWADDLDLHRITIQLVW